MTQMNLSMKQKQIGHSMGIANRLVTAKNAEEGMESETGVSRCKLFIYRMLNIRSYREPYSISHVSTSLVA